MVPAIAFSVCSVFTIALGSVYVYWRRVAVHVNGDSEDEDDEDDPENENNLRIAVETAALIDSESYSLDPKPKRRASVQGHQNSLWDYMMALVLRSPLQKNLPNTLMRRRNKGVKKIHKPYFYPLLNETAQWYAEWENKKQPVRDGAIVMDERIDKSKEQAPASPIDFLDGLDCSSLASFRSGTHIVTPLAVI